MKVFVIGGSTCSSGTAEFDQQIRLLECHGQKLGAELVARGHELVLCSPFTDSVDHYVAIGAAEKEDSLAYLEFHYPDLDNISAELKRFVRRLSAVQVERRPSAPIVSSTAKDALQYSWLFAQLSALDASGGVIAVGGKSTGASQLLFQFASARNKSILPLTFLGGAAADYYDSNYWDLHDVLKERLDDVTNAAQMQSAAELLESLVMGVSTREEDRFFISYARARPQDADFVETLLRRRNCTVYRDEEEFEPGAETQAEITNNIKRANVFIAIWCKEYACSPWCFDELELAMERQAAGQLKMWIFCVDDTRIVPKGARTLNYYRITTREELEGRILHLMGNRT